MSARLDVSSLGSFIREQREAAEVSLRQLAKTSGVSNPYLSQIERGLRHPSAEILGQIAKADPRGMPISTVAPAPSLDTCWSVALDYWAGVIEANEPRGTMLPLALRTVYCLMASGFSR